MNSRFRNRPLPAGNPIANALVVIVGVLAIALSLVLGFVAFVALAGVFLVMAAVVGIRLWWLQRKLRKRAGTEQARHEADSRVDIIEGEYHVISRSSRRQDD